MNHFVIQFGERNLLDGEIKNKRILECGALNVNGTLKDIAMKYSPNEYIGIDIQSGAGVDKVLNVLDIVPEFGENSFDYIISTEMLEHCSCWRCGINAMKSVLKPNGYMLVSTRSKGFGKHNYPADYWRYEFNDIIKIFSDFEFICMERDLAEPGILFKVKKPEDWKPNNLSIIKIESVE